MVSTAPDRHAGRRVSESAAAVAYERLKRMIVSLELVPGTPLTEPAFGSLLGMGRTPIREALLRLADERLVTIFPRRGMVVAYLGLSEVQQLFEARTLVEAANAKRAAKRASDSDSEELIRLNGHVHARKPTAPSRRSLRATSISTSLSPG